MIIYKLVIDKLAQNLKHIRLIILMCYIKLGVGMAGLF